MYDRVKGGKLTNNEWLVCSLEDYTFLTPARPTSPKTLAESRLHFCFDAQHAHYGYDEV